MSWKTKFDQSRKRLIESAEFVRLGEVGHQLRDGVVLTSISDVPFEMSFKCSICRGVFWFENPGAELAEEPRWRFNPAISGSALFCAPVRPAMEDFKALQIWK